MKYAKFNIIMMSLLTINCMQLKANGSQESSTLVAFNVVNELNKQKLPLHHIIKNQEYTTEEKLALMQSFLDKKLVEVNVQDADGRTALNLITFYKGHPKLAALLIKYKANVNEPDRFNQTPLHNAVAFDEIEIARMLLADNADVRFKNDEGLTPIDLARSETTQNLLAFT